MCKDVSHIIANKTMAADTVMLAVYEAVQDPEYCVFYVTRNLLDPPWRVQFVAQEFGLDNRGVERWRPAVLVRTQAALGLLVKAAITRVLPLYELEEELSFAWVYMQGRTAAPPFKSIDIPEMWETCENSKKTIGYEDEEDYDEALEMMLMYIGNVIEGLVATA